MYESPNLAQSVDANIEIHLSLAENVLWPVDKQ